MSIYERVSRNFPLGKVKQPKGRKGSLKWIQQIVNEYPDVLNKQINDSLGFSKTQPIEWLSPKANDHYSEYRDQAFLDLLGIELSKTNLSRLFQQNCWQLFCWGYGQSQKQLAIYSIYNPTLTCDNYF